MRRIPSLDRIKKLTGFEPKTNLQQTLKLIIDDKR
jgi:nucleoside-diphosphate-sugar epimerase